MIFDISPNCGNNKWHASSKTSQPSRVNLQMPQTTCGTRELSRSLIAISKYSLYQWFSKWAESPSLGRFWGTRKRTKQRGQQGGETTQRGRKRSTTATTTNRNAQPLPSIDHWVNFSFGCDRNALKAKKPLVDS